MTPAPLDRVGDRLRLAGAVARRRLKRRLARGAAGPNESRHALDDEDLWALPELYEGSYEVEPIGYATVRDFADSLDNFGGLIEAGAGMLGVQRAWMVKALLARVPRGSRLLEIEAGTPLVAGLLTRLGYEVTVVDPYHGGDGSGDYSMLTSIYPDVEFVRDRFPPVRALDPGFAAIYSISALGERTLEDLDEVTGAIARLLAPGGASLHAIDHVLAGFGAEADRERLDRLVDRCGLDRSELDAVIERMAVDPDTYLVSAEAHNDRRGAIAYDAYPMRRIGSVHLCAGGARGPRRPAGPRG